MLYSLGPVLGPSIAPLVGGFIVASIGWRWCFWILTILGACISVGLWLGLRETYPPIVKAQTQFKDEIAEKPVLESLRLAMVRPIILICTQPIVQFLALYQSLVYGIIFLMLSTFSSVWTQRYGESVQIGGLNYLSLAIGMAAGAQSGGFLLDRIYRRLKTRSPDQQGRPEYRIPLIFPGTLLICFGLLLYGWTAEYHVHWVVPNIGALLFAAGAFATFAIPQSYIIDAYPLYAASAIGVTAAARSLTGFGFPLFADAMFDKLGFGWGNSLLAFAALLIGWSGAVVLWLYGEKLRRASPYASE